MCLLNLSSVNVLTFRFSTSPPSSINFRFLLRHYAVHHHRPPSPVTSWCRRRCAFTSATAAATREATGCDFRTTVFCFCFSALTLIFVPSVFLFVSRRRPLSQSNSPEPIALPGEGIGRGRAGGEFGTLATATTTATANGSSVLYYFYLF